MKCSGCLPPPLPPSPSPHFYRPFKYVAYPEEDLYIQSISLLVALAYVLPILTQREAIFLHCLRHSGRGIYVYSNLGLCCSSRVGMKQ
jgi:hypothetical protein